MANVRGAHAVVLGASMAGLFAARVLSESYERVTIVERDALPAGAEHRRGVPQSRHVHVLLARGASILGELFPGFLSEAEAAGAPRIDALGNVRLLLSGQRLLQTDSGMESLLCGRPLLESLVRGRVRALDSVTFIDGYDVLGLAATPDGSRVVGARIQAEGGAEETLEADVVVDATGRGSRAPLWLEQLGHGRPVVEKIQVGLGYSSRTYRLPEGAMGKDRLILNNATPANPRAGALAEQENGLLRLTLAGMLGDRPPTEPKAFDEFAASLMFPDISEVIRDAEPLEDPVGFQYPASVRYRFERMRSFPEGFLVIGDALSSFNPIYAHGMSSSAMQAEALRSLLADEKPLTWRRYFQAASKAVNAPWQISAGADLAFPDVPGRRPAAVRMVNAYLPKVHAAAARDVEMSVAFVRVGALVDRPETLLRPDVMFRVFTARRRSAG